MKTGTLISGIGHSAIVAMALFGLPWVSFQSPEPLAVTNVRFVSEADLMQVSDTPPPVPDQGPQAAPEVEARQTSPEIVAAPEPAQSTVEQPARPDPVVSAPPDAPEIAVAPTTPSPSQDAPTPLVSAASELAPSLATPPQRRRPQLAPDPADQPVQEAVAPPQPEPLPEPTPDVAAAPVEEMEPSPEPPAPVETVAEEVSPAPEDTDIVIASRAPERLERPLQRPQNRQQSSTIVTTSSSALEQDGELTPAAPAAPEPVPEPDLKSTLENLVAEAARDGATVAPEPAQGLSTAVLNGFRLAVQRCWSVPNGLRNAQDLKVVIGVSFTSRGEAIRESIRLVAPLPVPDGAYQQAFDAGRRALLQCSPYTGLPPAQYDLWKEVEVVFNPEGMVQ